MPSAIRRAAGLPAAPGYLSTTTVPSGVNPDVRKLILLGVGLVFCVIVTLVLAPRHEADSAAQTKAPPKIEETLEERRQRVQTMFDGAFSKVSDGADFDQSRAYLDLVKGISRLAPEFLGQRATDWLDWNVAVSEPATVRGSYVKVRGLIASEVHTIKLQSPAGDVTDVWRCFIGQPDGSEPKVIDLVTKPDPELNLGRDVVDIDAIFFRLVGYDLEKSGKHVEVPYLVGQRLTIHQEPTRGPQGVARILLLIGLVAIGVLVAVVVARQRTTPRRHPALLNKPGVGIRAMFEMRRREGAAKPPPTAPKSP